MLCARHRARHAPPLPRLRHAAAARAVQCAAQRQRTADARAVRGAAGRSDRHTDVAACVLIGDTRCLAQPRTLRAAGSDPIRIHGRLSVHNGPAIERTCAWRRVACAAGPPPWPVVFVMEPVVRCQALRVTGTAAATATAARDHVCGGRGGRVM